MKELTKGQRLFTEEEKEKIVSIFGNYADSKEIELSKSSIKEKLAEFKFDPLEEEHLDIVDGLVLILENYLEDNSISIKNEERDLAIADGEIEESEAALIYGEEFYELEAEIANALGFKLYE